MEDEDFKLSMLLDKIVTSEQIDHDTIKLSNDHFEIYRKMEKVVLVIDKRDPHKKRMYNDIHTAYAKVFSA